jgi:hypothetical protein
MLRGFARQRALRAYLRLNLCAVGAVELILINANAGLTFNDAPVSSFVETPRSCPMSELGVRRDKAALSSGCEPHPATAPAGSNRSSHGGNEVAEAFD